MAELSFGEELAKIALDKGILAMVVLIVGYFLNKRLEEIKTSNTNLLNDYKSELDGRLEEQRGEQATQLELLRGEQNIKLLFSKNENDKHLEAFKIEEARLDKLAEQTQALKNEIQKLRETRAFDKQLDWYERTLRALHDMAQKIEIASTFEEENGDKAHRIRCWRDVQRAHLNLATLSDEAKLYGSEEAANETKSILDKVQDVADETDVFDAEFARQNLELIDTLPDKLRKAAKPLAKEARTHLGLD